VIRQRLVNTYASLNYRFVFKTKNREPWIHLDMEGRVWVLGGYLWD
jgi:hypothetical protein